MRFMPRRHILPRRLSRLRLRFNAAPPFRRRQRPTRCRFVLARHDIRHARRAAAVAMREQPPATNAYRPTTRRHVRSMPPVNE